MRRILVLMLILMMVLISGCSTESGTYQDKENTLKTASRLQTNQQTPTDIEYSLERYNLIKRAYWVNGQREKARMLPSPISDVPLGYAVLFTDNGGVVGKFVVEGKVSSLNSFLTPDSEYYSSPNSIKWLADIDGSYGVNDNGIFFFTPDGKYIEWTGTYLYSDIPFEVGDPIVKISSSK